MKHKKQKMFTDETDSKDPKSALNQIPPEIWHNQILPFLGDGSYRYIGGTNRQLKDMYEMLFPKKQTHVISSVAQAELALQEYGNSSMLCAIAARHGHLDVLQFLRRKYNCPWDSHTCRAAAQNGHLAVLQWARANGCPWSCWQCHILAGSNRHMPVWHWTREFLKQGKLMGMGSGESMQLGYLFPDDADVTINIPPSFLPYDIEMPMVRAGCMHNIALTSMGIPYSWGSNDGGALGRVTTNEEQEQTLTPVTGFVRNNAPYLDNEPIIDVAAGDCHSLFLSLSGAVFMCGSYRDDRGTHFSDQDGLDGTPLGENTLPVHVFQMPSPAVAVFAGGTMNAALLTDQSLVTWGLGNHGELARGTGSDLTVAEQINAPIQAIVNEHFLKPKHVMWQSNPTLKRTVISVAIGSNHLVVAARDLGHSEARLYTSGSNFFGQLGHGDSGRGVNRHALKMVEALRIEDVGQVAAGENFTLALTQDRSRLYSFGLAERGQLGITIRGEEMGEFRNTPQLVEFPEPVQILDISAGSSHGMAHVAEGQVYTWGFNDLGATGHADSDQNGCILLPRRLPDIPHHRVIGVSGGWHHSLLLVESLENGQSIAVEDERLLD